MIRSISSESHILSGIMVVDSYIRLMQLSKELQNTKL